jgi:hypothetical protein
MAAIITNTASSSDIRSPKGNAHELLPLSAFSRSSQNKRTSQAASIAGLNVSRRFHGRRLDRIVRHHFLRHRPCHRITPVLRRQVGLQLAGQHPRVIARLDRQDTFQHDRLGQQLFPTAMPQLPGQRPAEHVRHHQPVQRRQQRHRHAGPDLRRIVHLPQHDDQADQRPDHPECRCRPPQRFDDPPALCVPQVDALQLNLERRPNGRRVVPVDRHLHRPDQKLVVQPLHRLVQRQQSLSPGDLRQRDEGNDRLVRPARSHEECVPQDGPERPESGGWKRYQRRQSRSPDHQGQRGRPPEHVGGQSRARHHDPGQQGGRRRQPEHRSAIKSGPHIRHPLPKPPSGVIGR